MALHVKVHAVLAIYTKAKATYHRAQSITCKFRQVYGTLASLSIRQRPGQRVDHRITRTKCNNNRPSRGLIGKRLQAKRF